MYGAIRHWVFKRAGVKAAARIVEHTKKPGSNNVELQYEVYEYEFDGNVLRTEWGPVTKASPVGQTVNLILNAKKPDDILVEEALGKTIWRAILGLVLLAVGGLLSHAGLGLFLFRVSGN